MTSSMGSMPRGRGVTALCSRGGRSSNRHKPALGLIISEASNMSIRLKSSKDKGSTCQDQWYNETPPSDDTSRPARPTWPHSPVKPGVRAASFLARASSLRLSSNLSGRRWTLKMDDLPLMSGGANRERGTEGQGGVTCSHFTARALPCVSVLHTRLSDLGQGAPRGRNDPQVTYVQLFNTSKNFLTVEPLVHANPSQDRDPTTSKSLAALVAWGPCRTQVLNSQDLLTSGKGQGECFSR